MGWGDDVAEGSTPCVNDQPPVSPLSILFALLCPRMSFDLSLPFLEPLAFPAFLHPFLLLPMIFFRMYKTRLGLHPLEPCLLSALVPIPIQSPGVGTAVLRRKLGGE